MIHGCWQHSFTSQPMSAKLTPKRDLGDDHVHCEFYDQREIQAIA